MHTACANLNDISDSDLYAIKASPSVIIRCNRCTHRNRNNPDLFETQSELQQRIDQCMPDLNDLENIRQQNMAKDSAIQALRDELDAMKAQDAENILLLKNMAELSATNDKLRNELFQRYLVRDGLLGDSPSGDVLPVKDQEHNVGLISMNVFVCSRADCDRDRDEFDQESEMLLPTGQLTVGDKSFADKMINHELRQICAIPNERGRFLDCENNQMKPIENIAEILKKWIKTASVINNRTKISHRKHHTWLADNDEYWRLKAIEKDLSKKVKRRRNVSARDIESYKKVKEDLIIHFKIAKEKHFASMITISNRAPNSLFRHYNSCFRGSSGLPLVMKDGNKQACDKYRGIAISSILPKIRDNLNRRDAKMIARMLNGKMHTTINEHVSIFEGVADRRRVRRYWLEDFNRLHSKHPLSSMVQNANGIANNVQLVGATFKERMRNIRMFKRSLIRRDLADN